MISDGWTYTAKEVVWLIFLMCDLRSLEDLEIRGQCGCLLRDLRWLMMRGYPLPHIKTITVYSGGAGICQALRLKDALDGLGLGTIVACILDPKVLDDYDWEEDGSSKDWNWVEDWGVDNDQD